MKICACGICKNEEKNVLKWVESCKDADSLIVLDTGSSDKTCTFLENHGVNVFIKNYRDFRFDTARNDLMSIVNASDCDILFILDMDEYPEKGWRKSLEENWKIGNHLSASCLRQEHNFIGNNNFNILHDRILINSPIWHWKYPVFESLYADKEIPEESLLNIPSEIIIHHYPSINNKKNTLYRRLLEKRLLETPDSLSRYLYYKYIFDYSIIDSEKKESMEGLVRVLYENIDNTIDKFYLGECARVISSFLYDVGELDTAELVAKRGLFFYPEYSGLYVELSKIKFKRNKVDEAIFLIDKAIDLNDFGFVVVEGSLNKLLEIKNFYLKDRN